MEKKKYYQHPSMIVIKLEGKDGLMGPYSEGDVGVRRHRGDIDWEEE